MATRKGHLAIKTVFSLGYTLAILVALIWFPLVTLHGYHQWWVDTFYAAWACAAIAGNISHYLVARRPKGLAPVTDLADHTRIPPARSGTDTEPRTRLAG